MDDPTEPPSAKRNGNDAMPPRPPWVKVFAAIFVVLAGAFASLHVTGNSPGRHTHGPASPATKSSAEQLP